MFRPPFGVEKARIAVVVVVVCAARMTRKERRMERMIGRACVDGKVGEREANRCLSSTYNGTA